MQFGIEFRFDRQNGKRTAIVSLSDDKTRERAVSLGLSKEWTLHEAHPNRILCEILIMQREITKMDARARPKKGYQMQRKWKRCDFRLIFSLNNLVVLLFALSFRPYNFDARTDIAAHTN